MTTTTVNGVPAEATALMLETRALRALMAKAPYKTDSGRFGVAQSTSGGIRVIEISGALRPRGAAFHIGDEVYTASYEGLTETLAEARADAGVRGVLLRIDSPGGMAAGMQEAAEAVRATAAVKPVYAFADPLAASAAYGIASQATRLYAPKMGMVGSVGVILMHVDATAMLAQAGFKVTEITYGRKKAQGSPWRELSDEDRADFQAEVDRHGAEFTALVAAGRGIALEAVRGTEAALLSADAALELGFIDGTATFAEVTALLEQAAGRTSSAAVPAARVEVKEREAEMAERTEPAAASTCAPPELPVKGSGEARGAGQGNAPSAASAKVDAAAVMEACGRYGLDAATSVVLARNCDSTDDAKQIAQLFAMEGKPAWMAEAIQKPGVTAEAMRDELFERKTKRDAGFDVNGANAGDEIPEGGDARAAVLNAVDQYNEQLEARRNMGVA